MNKRGKFIVLGVGTEGCNAVKRMTDRNIEGIELAVADDDEKRLNSCNVSKKILLNESFSREDCKKIFTDNFHDTDIFFIIDIFGTKTMFARNIAYAAKSFGALTLGIPFKTDGIDEQDIQRFKDYSDAVITSLSYCDIRDTPGDIVEGIADMILRNNHVNFDFEDMKSILTNTGTAFFASFYVHALDEAAIENSVFSAANVLRDIHDVKGILVNVSACTDVTLGEISKAVRVIEDIADTDAQVIWGHYIDESMRDAMRITLLIGLNDHGCVNYRDMFQNESVERLASFVRDGLDDFQIFRFGSREKFLADGLMYGTPEIIKLFIENAYDLKSLESDGVFPEDILTEIVSRKDAAKVLRIIFTSGITISNNLIEPFMHGTLSADVLREFINYGWNVNSHTNRGTTVLMRAAEDLSVECMRVLIEAGADVNAEDKDGINAFTYAAEKIYCRPDIVKLFIDAGINLNAKDDVALELMLKHAENDVLKAEFDRKVLPLMIRSGADSRILSANGYITERSYLRRDISLFLDAIAGYDTWSIEYMLCSLPPKTIAAEKKRIMQNYGFAFRTNYFPEAEMNPSEENLEIKLKLDAGTKILKLLKKAGINVPVSAPGGRELTYLVGKSDVILTSYEGEVPDNEFEALCCAYSSGALKSLIDSGVDVNAKVYSGQSALKVIAENYKDYYDPAEMIDVLISNGADVSPLIHTWIGECLAPSNEYTSYVLLNDMKKIEIIMEIMSRREAYELILKNAKAIEGIYTYHRMYRNPFRSYLLLHMWNNIKSCSDFRYAEGDSLQRHKDMKLIAASYCGNKKDIDEAIRDGADVNCKTDLGYTPLMYASVFNNAEIARYLIRKGASVDARNNYGENVNMLLHSTENMERW